MACTLSNKCAKNLSKRTVQLIIKNVVTCFFGTQCTYYLSELQFDDNNVVSL